MLKHELITVVDLGGSPIPTSSPPPGSNNHLLRFNLTIDISKQHRINSRPSYDSTPFNQVVSNLTVRSCVTSETIIFGRATLLDAIDAFFLCCVIVMEKNALLHFENRDYYEPSLVSYYRSQ